MISIVRKIGMISPMKIYSIDIVHTNLDQLTAIENPDFTENSQ